MRQQLEEQMTDDLPINNTRAVHALTRPREAPAHGWHPLPCPMKRRRPCPMDLGIRVGASMERGEHDAASAAIRRVEADAASRNAVRIEARRSWSSAIHRTEPRSPMRGLAVLLALVAVGAAVILTLALTSTRDQTVITGDSIARVAAARAASAGSVDFACAVIERHGVAGFEPVPTGSTALFPPVVVGGATYSAEIFDLATGSAITDYTGAVRIVARGEAEGIAQVATAVGRLYQPDYAVRADLDLSEFGLLTSSSEPGSIAFTGASSLGVWKASPMAALREPVLVGASSLNADAVSIQTPASANGYAVLTNGRFPVDDDELSEAIADREFPVPQAIHVPHAPRPGRSTYAYEFVLASRQFTDLESYLHLTPIEGSIPADLAYHRGNINIIGDLHLHDDSVDPIGAGPNHLYLTSASTASSRVKQVDISGNLRLGSGDEIIVQCPTLLIVRGDLHLQESRIRVAMNAPLTVIVFGRIRMSNSFIHVDDAFDALPPEINYPDGMPQIMIYGTNDRPISGPQPGVSFPTMEFAEQSIVQGQIYAPHRAVVFSNSSKLFGRAVGASIQFSDSNFYYDPALNEGRGWTNPLSGVWENSQTPRESVLRVAEANDLSLAIGTGSSEAPTSVVPGGVVIAVDTPSGGVHVPAHSAYVGGSGSERLRLEIEALMDSLSFEESVRTEGTPAAIQLAGMLFDFREARSPLGHPDFAAIQPHQAPYERMLSPMLTAAGRPQLGSPMPRLTAYMNGGEEVCWNLHQPGIDTLEMIAIEVPDPDAPPAGPPIESAESFGTWFSAQRGVNLSMPIGLTMRQIGNSGHYQLDFAQGLSNPAVRHGWQGNPARGQLFGDLPALTDPTGTITANGHFSMEFAMEFIRVAGPGPRQEARITTNGDAWVFVNGVLAAELGAYPGSSARGQRIDLDRLSIPDGSIARLQVFYAHRGVDQPVFNLSTTFPVWQPADVYSLEEESTREWTNPQGSVQTLQQVDEVVRDAKAQGDYEDVETIYGSRSGNWVRSLQQPGAGPAPYLPPLPPPGPPPFGPG
jgi:fibro-slime domain-containing protein